MPPDPLVVPGQIALVAIDLEAGPPDAVALPRVDDKLGGHPESAQRLVQLIGILQRHVPIFLAAHHQGRGGHVADREER